MSRSSIKRLLRPILRVVSFIRVVWYDAWRFYKFSGITTKDTECLLTGIVSNYHVIEKGLSFREMGYGYGREIVEELINLLILYKDAGGCTYDTQYASGIKVLHEYLKIHEDEEKNKSEKVKAILNAIKEFLNKIDDEQIINNSKGGYKVVHKSDYMSHAKGDYSELSFNRCSIRNFSKEEISEKELYEAIKLAQKSPSTCNRQSTRIYLISKENVIQKILKIQSGTRGFSQQVRKLLIIAGDLRACLSHRDRNQVWVDAGLFAMSLLYGLQYKGLGACILHWSVEKKRDIQLRDLTGIKPEQTVVCLIAIGQLHDTFKVPNSQRKDLSEILVEIK